MNEKATISIWGVSFILKELKTTNYRRGLWQYELYQKFITHFITHVLYCIMWVIIQYNTWVIKNQKEFD